MAYRGLRTFIVESTRPDGGIMRRTVQPGDRLPASLEDPAMIADGRCEEVASDAWDPPAPFPGADTATTIGEYVFLARQHAASRRAGNERWGFLEECMHYAAEKREDLSEVDPDPQGTGDTLDAPHWRLAPDRDKERGPEVNRGRVNRS